MLGKKSEADAVLASTPPRAMYLYNAPEIKAGADSGSSGNFVPTAPADVYADPKCASLSAVKNKRVVPVNSGSAGYDAGLALGGAALQAAFRNPLVSPQIFGVSSAASFGGVLGLMLVRSSPSEFAQIGLHRYSRAMPDSNCGTATSTTPGATGGSGTRTWPSTAGITSILGPNGQGKTTLLRCVAGLTPPREGRITGIGYVLQAALPSFAYSVFDMVRMGRAKKVSAFATPGRTDISRTP